MLGKIFAITCQLPGKYPTFQLNSNELAMIIQHLGRTSHDHSIPELERADVAKKH